MQDPTAGSRLRALRAEAAGSAGADEPALGVAADGDGEPALAMATAEAMDLIEGSGALDQARARAREYRDRALGHLSSVADSWVREELVGIVSQAVDRES